MTSALGKPSISENGADVVMIVEVEIVARVMTWKPEAVFGGNGETSTIGGVGTCRD